MSIDLPRFTTFQLGDAIRAGRDQPFVDGISLGEQLKPAKERGVPGHYLELLVGAELEVGWKEAGSDRQWLMAALHVED
jgi:hypothetical protein